jgi:nucleotide-binding universal stress UspA family protein
MTARPTILAAVDFSACSMHALRKALDLARGTGAALHVIHVLPSSLHSPELFAHAPDELRPALRAEAHLAAACGRAHAEGVAATAHLRTGDPVPVLLEAIEELCPDLVVAGSHGRGAVLRALMGSVSSELWQRSPVPVVAVPLDEAAAARTMGDDVPLARDIAWSCDCCGHIRDEVEPHDRCLRCGLRPGRWNWAPVFACPADATVEPAVGEAANGLEQAARPNVPTTLFATAPPGVEGYDVNPELRVRY